MVKKKYLAVYCALALLAGCSLFTQRPPASPEQEIAQAFAAAFKQDGVAAAILSTQPLPAETLTTGQISVVISGHLSKAQTRDGGWIVQVPRNGAKILEYSTTEGSAGAVLNVRGNNVDNIHEQNLTLPRHVVPADALIVTSTYNSSAGRAEYWSVPGRSAVDEMLPIIFVRYQARSEYLRPPAIGDGFLPRFFRSHPIPEAAIKMDRLPSVVDIDNLGVNWGGWGNARPDVAYLVGLLGPFGGDCYDGWNTDTKTPDFQHPGYGSYYASIVSQALVTLCSTEPLEERRLLAIAIAQRGLDLVGAFSDGRNNRPVGGGHMQGRKALLMMCGHLLNVRPFANPNRFIGKMFQEDVAFQAGEWWFGSGWNSTWGFSWQAPFNGGMLANPPSTWGDPNSSNHSTWAWMIGGYIPQVCGSQVGTALAMHLCHLDVEMGVNYMGMMKQWMDGPPAAAQEELLQAGIDIPWGTDYALDRGGDFCKRAWELHF